MIVAAAVAALLAAGSVFPWQAQVSQPALISDAVIEEGDWDPVIDWIRANVPSERFQDLATVNMAMAVWVDEASILRTGSTVQAWIHIEFFSAEAVSATNVRSMMVLHEYRCSTRQQRQLAGTSYSGTNRSGDTEPFDESRPSAWRYVRPDQIDQEILAAACDGIRIFDGTTVQ